MSWLARIEETCAAFIERAFANMFPSDVEPAQIARKLVATMEARTQTQGGSMTAPARYHVRVNPVDYARLKPHRAYLEEEWSALLQDVAARVGISFESAAAVELHEDEEVVLGGIEIDPQLENAQPAYVLRVVTGMPAGERFSISGTARVGRSRENEIFLVDPSVSRVHAYLEYNGDHLLVRDAGSTNGTFVNGERVQLRALHPGDHVAFGKTEMIVQADSGS